MKESRRITRYYKQRMYHGRSTAARAFDFAALRLIFLCACYLWFLNLTRFPPLAAALSVISMLMFSVVMSLLQSIRLDRFIAKERARLTEESLREQLALTPPEEFASLAQQAAETLEDYDAASGVPLYRGRPCIVYPLQRLSPAGADDLLAAYHTARRRQVSDVLLYTAVPAGAEADSFCRRLSEVHIHIQPPDALLAILLKQQQPEDPDELVRRKLADALAEKRKKRAQPFAKGQTRRYLVCTAVLAAASFAARYALYYRMLAGVCAVLAGVSFFLNGAAGQKEIKA